jgi:hypothetical protein
MYLLVSVYSGTKVSLMFVHVYESIKSQEIDITFGGCIALVIGL